jgi:hypothetical protein
MKRRRLILPLTSLPLCAVLAWLWLASGPAGAQDPAGDLLALINNARLVQGLPPYVISAELATAAQRHSDDLAATGQVGHTGSDGSSDVQRVLDAGYSPYEFGPVVGENVYGGPGGAEVPFSAWMGTPAARSNLLHAKYREVGIGVASDAQGRAFWTVTFGARPNVLPVLINDGVDSVDTITVTLRLVPENVVPEGRGTAMGQPIEYRASTGPQFIGVEWGPWAERVGFVLDEGPGQQTVYVQLRDAAGRTAISWVSVALTGLEVTVTPTGLAETPTPGTPTATATRAATATPATPTPTPQTPTATVPPSATPTPTLRAEPQDEAASATAQPSPTATLTPTPLPSATSVPPTGAATATSSPPPTRTPEASVVPPTSTQPIPAEVVVEEEPEPPSLAARVAPWALGLQLVALALGVYVALRRPAGGVTGEREGLVNRDDVLRNRVSGRSL